VQTEYLHVKSSANIILFASGTHCQFNPLARSHNEI
jgi:hypothetical protein